MNRDPFRLLEELRDAGLTVRGFGYWASVGRPWADGRPAATQVHHTAPPIPYPLRDLAGVDTGRIKCNINVKQNGDVWLVAFGACNYASGPGSSFVLEQAKADIMPTENADTRGLVDDMGGNSHFWNIEVDHRGDGSPLPAAAESALTNTCTVLGEFWGYPPGRVVSHAEWTARKIDPYWGGSERAAIERLRSLIESGGNMQGPNGEPNWEDVSSWFQPSWSWAYAQGLLSVDDPATPSNESTQPQAPVNREELMAILQRYDDS